MQKHFFRFRKVFQNIACGPFILISNNLELVAKHLPNDFEKPITTLEINKSSNSFFRRIDTKQEKNFLIAENILLILSSQGYQKPNLGKRVLGPQLFQLKPEGLLKLF